MVGAIGQRQLGSENIHWRTVELREQHWNLDKMKRCTEHNGGPPQAGKGQRLNIKTRHTGNQPTARASVGTGLEREREGEQG